MIFLKRLRTLKSLKKFMDMYGKNIHFCGFLELLCIYLEKRLKNAYIQLVKSGDYSSAQDFLYVEVVTYIKNYFQLNFLANLKMLERSYIHLKNAENAIFAK